MKREAVYTLLFIFAAGFLWQHCDNFQNFKRYDIPKAQLVIADKFFECATNRVFKIIPKAEGDENEN